MDLWQQRTRGNPIANDTDAGRGPRWRETWFHKGWLEATPPTTASGRWPPRSGTGSTAAGAAAAGRARAPAANANLWTFRPTGYDHPVGVYSRRPRVRAGDGGRRWSSPTGCSAAARGRPGCRAVRHRPAVQARPVDRRAQAGPSCSSCRCWTGKIPAVRQAFGAGRTGGTRLARPDRLNGLIEQVLGRARPRGRGGAPRRCGKLIIAGSLPGVRLPGATGRAAPRPGHASRRARQADQVWAFDTTYGGNVERWTDWLAADPGLQVHVFFRPGSRTAALGERFERAQATVCG